MMMPAFSEERTMNEETNTAEQEAPVAASEAEPKAVKTPAVKKAAPKAKPAPKAKKEAPKKAPKAQPPKKAAPKAKATTEGGTRGRVSQYAGLKIFKLVSKNPRKEGTNGHASFSLITSGIRYEKYRELGGRNEDLAFDIAKGYVEVRQS
jgi:hypothetical protein